MLKAIFSKLFNAAAKPASVISAPEKLAVAQISQPEIVTYYKAEI